MDVKEAITQLTGLKKYCEGMAECDESGSYVFDLDVQALDMAISALSQPNEPLTQADLDSMDYDKVWIDYGDGTGEWALVCNGYIYSIDTLEGAGLDFERRGTGASALL